MLPVASSVFAGLPRHGKVTYKLQGCFMFEVGMD
jgi:hypothetical protein